jgi:DNA-binding CsgD family transcriptional regulator
LRDRSTDLLERAAELGELESALAGAADCRGAALLIEGPPGIGKTSLLRAATGLAAGAGFVVLTATAGVFETDLAWSLVRQLFAAVLGAPAPEREELLAGAAALAAPALGLTAGAESGSLHGLYWLTAALAERRPLLLAVDDAHWGDEPSLRFVAHLAGRVEDLPVLVAVACRDGGRPGPALTALGAAAETRLLRPRELSPAGSAALTRRVLGAGADAEFCAACHRASGGSPFLLDALLAQLREEGVEPRAANVAAAAGAAPEAVRRSLLLQLSRLPAAADLAEAVALLGDGCGLAEAATLAELSPEAAASAADALGRAAILAPEPPLAFRHPLVREILYAEIPAHRRGRRHRNAAGVLTAAGAAAERVQAQLLRSEPAGDDAVVAQLREGAAAATRQGAPGTAADLLERALREPPAAGERGTVIAELGRAELAAGRSGAVARLAGAAELSVGAARASVLRDLGRASYAGGDPAAAAAAFRDALDALDEATDADDPSLSAELEAAWIAVARNVVELRPEAVALVNRIAADPPVGDSHGERALLAQVAGEVVLDGRSQRDAATLAHRALAGGRLLAEETADGLAWGVAAGVLAWCDDLDGYDEVNRQALADARRRGSAAAFATVSHGLVFSDYQRGRLADAVADAEQALAGGGEAWAQFLPVTAAQLAWTEIERDRLGRAEAALALAADPRWGGSSMQTFALEARARLLLARGEAEAALAAAIAAGEIATEAMIPNPALCPWRSTAALAAAQDGERERAAELAAEELALARRFGAPRPLAVALMATAAAAPGRRALEPLQEAATILADSPARLERARALVLLGGALRRDGRLKPAREVLRHGLDLARACGAARLERQARTELEAAGARVGSRPSSGADSLTPAERRVAELAAAGASNREIAQALFVSLRTVETHLTHSYRKLGISSRDALGASLQERPPGT